jgi:hypothetical protein
MDKDKGPLANLGADRAPVVPFLPFDVTDYFISMAVTTLLLLMTNPVHAVKFKAALLKVGRMVNQIFPGEICK